MDERDGQRVGKVAAMSAKGTVVYLSSCAVDGKGTPDTFMLQELPWLQKRFKNVWMVSYYGVAELTAYHVSRMEPIIVRDTGRAAWRARLRACFVPEVWWELVRVAKDGKLSPRNLIKLFLFAVRGQKLHLWLEDLLRKPPGENITLYAYWMSYEAYAAALSKRKHKNLRLLVRGHAFEIDEQRNAMNPYLMKQTIFEMADRLFLISEYAKQQYLRYMKIGADNEKLRVLGVGSRGEKTGADHAPPLFSEGCLKLVSCATISEIKQLPVLVDALSCYQGVPLRWLHLGGGPEEAAVRAYAAEKLAESPAVSFEISGRIENETVQETYAKQGFDLFVNTSRMEGVPVSMMEAMRFGIPIIAPRVGGIPELVDDAVGILYEADHGAQGVLEAIERFAALTEEKVLSMRAAAKARWENDCRSEALLPLLFETADENKQEVK